MTHTHHVTTPSQRRASCRAILAMALLSFLYGCSARQTPPVDAAVGVMEKEGAVQLMNIQELEGWVGASTGKATVINFWATWCAPCVSEMPELAAFYQAHTGTVRFLALSLDLPEQLETKVKPFVQERKLPFPVRVLSERDIEGVSRAVRHEISGALPTTLILDREGRVVQFWEGAVTEEMLAQAVKPLLS